MMAPCWRPSAAEAWMALVLSCLLAPYILSVDSAFTSSAGTIPTRTRSSSSGRRVVPLLAADDVHDRQASASVPPVPFPPRYSDPAILRDRSHVIPADRGFDYRGTDEGGDAVSLSPTLFEVLARSTSRIVPFQDGKVFVKRRSRPIGSPE